MNRWSSLGLIVLIVHAASASSVRAEPQAKGEIDFNRQIRPILSENCFACHGPDAASRKGKLRLDTKEGAFALGRSGKHILTPGKLGASELIARITSTDDTEVMPTPKSGKKLTPEQIALLKRWVEQGATWSEHWAFIPPQRPELPKVATPNWTRNAIDHFVLARLEKEKLQPARTAEKTTLIRRVTLDLTGLPPTPKEVEDFLNDRSDTAYEKVVDRLLKSSRYGERMAMWWLDGARYADSNGYQADYERYMWRWRDWVIGAFIDNMPFDQFTIEQMAGDMLPEAKVEQKIATGFHRNHRINTEGGIIAEEWRVETVVDRIETTSSVWLGLTMGCARCHDHKYDPITQKEFYQFFAFFNNIPESGVGVERPVNHPPLVKASGEAEKARMRELDAAIVTAQQRVKELEKTAATLQSDWEKTALTVKPGPTWITLEAGDMKSAGGAKLTRQPDLAILATGRVAAQDTYSVTAPVALKRLTGLRLEALPHDSMTNKGPGRSVNGNFILSGVNVTVGKTAVKLARAAADFSQEGYAVSAALDDKPETGWAIHPRVGEAHTAFFAFDKPVAVDDSKSVTVQLEFRSNVAVKHVIGHFRLAVTDAEQPLDQQNLPGAIHALLKLPVEKRTAQQKQQLSDYFRAQHGGELTRADQAVQAAKKARTEYEANLPTVMVLEEMPQPREAFVLLRGVYDKKGEKVKAGVPSVFPALPQGVPVNRLGLAKWMVAPNNPLTARVAVNRLWERYFGTGLVKSSENFGVQGDSPSHPELLDWLATEFVRVGWDLKALQKLIVMSATYQQASSVVPELHERDPENRLLARGPRFRLQAEVIRDNALAISGLLVDRVGGPSVRPYQPAGVWDETNVYGNLRNYKHDQGDNLYRRSMYTIWKRTAAPPTMLLFDSPSRELCAVRRARTNTPLQALALLNEVTFVEASRALAERAIRQGGTTPEERLTYAFQRATARQPSNQELQLLTTGLKRRLAHYRDNPEAARKLLAVGDFVSAAKLDPAEWAAYTITASVLLNLDETLTKE